MAKLFLSLAVILAVGAVNAEVITSPEVTNWGDWAPEFERCPAGTAVQGFQLLVEGPQGPADDTTCNGIKFFCGDPNQDATPTIQSRVGPWGGWRNRHRCTLNGYMTGFQMRVETPDVAQDETATNDLRIFCTKGNGEYVEGDGGPFGLWGEERHCPEGQVVIGLRTQVHEDQGNLRDDTALNNIELECGTLLA